MVIVGKDRLINYLFKIFNFLPSKTNFIFIINDKDEKKYNLKKTILKKYKKFKIDFISLKKNTKSELHSILKVDKLIKNAKN